MSPVVEGPEGCTGKDNNLRRLGATADQLSDNVLGRRRWIGHCHQWMGTTGQDLPIVIRNADKLRNAGGAQSCWHRAVWLWHGHLARHPAFPPAQAAASRDQ